MDMIRRFGNHRLKSITNQDIAQIGNNEYLEVVLASAARNYPYLFGYNDNSTVGGDMTGYTMNTEISSNVVEKAYVYKEILKDASYIFKLFKRNNHLFLIKDGKERVTQLIDDSHTYPIIENALLEYSDRQGNVYYIGYDTSYNTNPKNGTLGTSDLQTAIDDDRYHFRIEHIPENGVMKAYRIYNIGTGYYLTRRNNKEYIWSQSQSTLNPYFSYGAHNNVVYFGIHAESKNNAKTVKIQYENRGGVENYKFGEGDVNKAECMWQIISLEVQPSNTSLILPYDNQTAPWPVDEVRFGEPVNNIWMEEDTPLGQGNLLYGYNYEKTYRIFQNSNIGDEKCLIHNASVNDIQWGGVEVMRVTYGLY